MKRQLLIILIICSFTLKMAYSQDRKPADSLKSTEKKAPFKIEQKVFGNINFGFYHDMNNKRVPQSAFELKAGILGYSCSLSEKVKALIMFDVTKTSRLATTDSLYNRLTEGSNYTAYLKQAEIDWKVNSFFELAVGELLNEQYLTVQDKFWGMRYIDVTMQEKSYPYYGMPADYGARAIFNYKDKIKFSVSAFNGDGPFRTQDTKSKYLFSGNLEVYYIKNLTLKLYADAAQPSTTKLENKYSVSGFAGYQVEKFRIGAEYNTILNYNFIKSKNIYGMSVYGVYNITSKFGVLARYDFGYISPIIKDGKYSIAGIQYEPTKNFKTSINYRNSFNPGNYSMIYFSFGIKF